MVPVPVRVKVEERSVPVGASPPTLRAPEVVGAVVVERAAPSPVGGAADVRVGEGVPVRRSSRSGRRSRSRD